MIKISTYQLVNSVQMFDVLKFLVATDYGELKTVCKEFKNVIENNAVHYLSKRVIFKLKMLSRSILKRPFDMSNIRFIYRYNIDDEMATHVDINLMYDLSKPHTIAFIRSLRYSYIINFVNQVYLGWRYKHVYPDLLYFHKALCLNVLKIIYEINDGEKLEVEDCSLSFVRISKNICDYVNINGCGIKYEKFGIKTIANVKRDDGCKL